MIYFDNAATAGARPEAVGEAMLRALRDVSANPGRSGHWLSLEAARIVENAREELASLLGVPDPAHLVFTKNATEAINIVLFGFLREGDLVLTSAWEHNAVLRPLRWLERTSGVRVEIIPPGDDRPVDLEWLNEKLLSMPVRLVALTAASNVTGEVMPIAQVGARCRERDVFLLVDAAQGAGVLDLDVEREGVGALAVTGHKSLYGPPGTGALYLREPDAVEPLIRGGTGSRSEHEEQPDFVPDKFEAGTANVPALAGLAVGIGYVKARGLGSIRTRHRGLVARLIERLRKIPGLELHGPSDPARQLALVSFTVNGFETSELARAFERRGVLCRPGLHCAPRAHRTLGTFPRGTIRFSLSTFNTEDEIDTAAEAAREIALAGS